MLFLTSLSIRFEWPNVSVLAFQAESVTSAAGTVNVKKKKKFPVLSPPVLIIKAR